MGLKSCSYLLLIKYNVHVVNNFLRNFQPTIVRASYDETLPESIKGKFFINLNIVGINYINEESDLDIIDIPRVFIIINDKLVNDNSNLLYDFIVESICNPDTLAYGINGFVCGEDYYLNDTLYDFLSLYNEIDINSKLPNYLDENGQMTSYWIDFLNEPYGYYTNVEYFNKKNKILDFQFSEEELNNFYANFCKLILDYTEISNETKNLGNNPIYNVVLNYFSNFKSDSGSIALQLVLGSLYTSTTNNTICGCTNSSLDSTVYSSKTCYDSYSEAMNAWIMTMLGDFKFYEDWFFIDNGASEKIVNDALIDILELLITEFLALGNNLVFSSSSRKPTHCVCPDVTIDEHVCNYNIINNYLQVLEFVRENKISENKNKIKIYGEQFGSLLPKLQF